MEIIEVSDFDCPTCGVEDRRVHGTPTTEGDIQVSCPVCAYSHFIDRDDVDDYPQPEPGDHALDSRWYEWGGHNVLGLHLGETLRFECDECGLETTLDVTPSTGLDSIRTVEAARVFNARGCTSPSKNATIPDKFIPGGELRIGGGPP